MLRASIGLMYEPPLLDFYDNAILSNGDPRASTCRCRSAPTAGGAGVSRPAWPTRRRRLRPAAAEHHRRRSGLRDAVGLADQRAGRARAEQRPLGRRRLRQLDRPQPAGADRHQPRADRRRRLATAARSTRRRVSAATRVDPTFNHVNVFQSIGESHLQRVHRDADQADDARAGRRRPPTRWRAARTTRRSPAPTSSAAATIASRIRRTSIATRASTPFNQTHTLRRSRP